MTTTFSRNPAEITLERTRGFRWATARRDDVTARAVGFAADGSRSLTSSDLADRFASLTGNASTIAHAAVELLRRLPGGCAVVIESSDAVIALTDHIRSFPLYYGTDGGTLVLSDSADDVRRRIRATQIDDDAIEELMLTTYVTGRDTAVRGVSQMLSGECITWTWPRDAAAPHAHVDRHFVYLPNGPDADEAALEQRIADSLDRAFERFFVTTAGRRIVVPLSGGCDSRIIACMVARHGRRDALTFTYGRPRDRDVVRAMQTARTLGLRCVHVPHTHRSMRPPMRAARMRPLMAYSNGLSAVTHLQDWPAINEMVRLGQMTPGDVVAPGHVSIIHGAHVPAPFMGPGPFTRDDVIEQIFANYYRRAWDWSDRAYLLRDKLARRVATRLEPIEVRTGADASRAVEAFEWQERQAKYLLNSVRSYEHLGFEWRMPLCDPDWARAMGDAPLAQRFDRRLYWKMLDERYFKPMGVGIERIEATPANWRPRGVARVLDAVYRHALRIMPQHDRAVVEHLGLPEFARLPLLEYPRLFRAFSARFGCTTRLPDSLPTLVIATYLTQREIIRRTTDPAYDAEPDTHPHA